MSETKSIRQYVENWHAFNREEFEVFFASNGYNARQINWAWDNCRALSTYYIDDHGKINLWCLMSNGWQDVAPRVIQKGTSH